MSVFAVVWLVVAQPLGVSSVHAETRREVLRSAPPEAQVLPTLDVSSLSKQARSDFEVVRQRFVAMARSIRHEGFGPRNPAGESAMAPPGPVRGVIAATLKTNADTSTWTLTSNALTFERSGPGCCPPCPCAPNGACAPCVVCVERGECRSSVRGVQLVMTFTVEGRSLTREESVVQTVEWVEPPPAPPPQWTIRVEFESPEKPQVDAALRARLKVLTRCLDEVTPARPLTIDGLVLPTGRLSLRRSSSDGGPCLHQVLSSMVLGARPPEPVPLTIFLEPASP
jgi:hypothetical protein